MEKNNVVSGMLWGEKSESSIGTKETKEPSSNHHPISSSPWGNRPTARFCQRDRRQRVCHTSETKKKLMLSPPFCADSLPDRWGNMVFDQWAAQNHILAQLTPVITCFHGKREWSLWVRPRLLVGIFLPPPDRVYTNWHAIFEEREEYPCKMTKHCNYKILW